MNYELALKLKEAGFSQEYFGGHYQKPDGYLTPQMTFKMEALIDKDSAYIPTLSELIEACGEELESLHRRSNGWQVDRWSYPDGYYVGSTPEEAVARLWLALKGK